MYPMCQLRRMVFLSIQTVGIGRELGDLPERMQELWVKSNQWRNECDYEEMYLRESGLLAEFGKIIQINAGRIKEIDGDGNGVRAKIISIEGEEVDILEKMREIFKEITMPALCGHHIKEFTIPFLIKRFRINGINKIPECLHVFGKKPWEITCLDTGELWQAGGRGRTSLELISEVMGLNEDREESEGDDTIHDLYWSKRPEKIREIGIRKVLKTINLLLKLNGHDTIRYDDIEFERIT